MTYPISRTMKPSSFKDILLSEKKEEEINKPKKVNGPG